MSDRLECLAHLAKPLDVELNCKYRHRKNELPSSLWQLCVCVKSWKEMPYTVSKKMVDCQDTVMGIEEECL